MKTEKTITEKGLTKEDFESKFMEDLGECEMKIVLKKTGTTLTYPDMADSVFHDYTVVLEVKWDADIFRNKALLNIDCIDFEKKCLSGHIGEDHINDALFSGAYGEGVKDYKAIKL
jgi:hypothetical protein